MDFQLLHYFLTKFKITYFYNYLKKLTDIIVSKKDIFLRTNCLQTKIPFITEWDFFTILCKLLLFDFKN